ncbi:MAG: FmdB family zinc ribbon protein [Terracidiphilus sp.]
MPLYAYRCTQCGYHFEKIQSFKSQPERICPKCQGALDRPLSAPRLHFKGAGWYVNDYGGKNGSVSTEARTAEPALETAKAAASADKTPAAAAASGSAPAAAPACAVPAAAGADASHG